MRGLFFSVKRDYQKYHIFSLQKFPRDKVAYMNCSRLLVLELKQLETIRDKIEEAINEIKAGK